jgi:alkylhydroperoxidase family enzyme
VLHGRAAGLSDEKLGHLGDAVLPDGLYDADEEVIVRYAQTLTRLEPITDALYAQLAGRFTTDQIMDLCLIVGTASLVNRFHATFLTDLDERTREALDGGCPVPLPEHPSAPGRRQA